MKDNTKESIAVLKGQILSWNGNVVMTAEFARQVYVALTQSARYSLFAQGLKEMMGIAMGMSAESASSVKPVVEATAEPRREVYGAEKLIQQGERLIGSWQKTRQSMKALDLPQAQRAYLEALEKYGKGNSVAAAQAKVRLKQKTQYFFELGKKIDGMKTCITIAKAGNTIPLEEELDKYDI